MDLSIVVPVYKCPEALAQLYERTVVALEPLQLNWELILVNDACPLDSWSEIKRLCQSDARVKGLNFSRNFGQHRAIAAGLEFATGTWHIVMDCDLQDEPEEIPRLYETVLSDPRLDYVRARRAQRQDGLMKISSSRLFYSLLYYFTDRNYDPAVGNFGIYHKRVIDAILNMREQLFFFPCMVLWVGFSGVDIDIHHSPRFAGKSSYSYSRLMKLGLDIIVAFSDKPLRLAIQTGFFFSGSAFLYALGMIINHMLYKSPVMGWPSLIVSVSFFSGLIILFLGVIGVYLGRIFEETKGRPKFIVKEIYNGDDRG